MNSLFQQWNKPFTDAHVCTGPDSYLCLRTKQQFRVPTLFGVPGGGTGECSCSPRMGDSVRCMNYNGGRQPAALSSLWCGSLWLLKILNECLIKMYFILICSFLKCNSKFEDYGDLVTSKWNVLTFFVALNYKKRKVFLVCCRWIILGRRFFS